MDHQCLERKLVRNDLVAVARKICYSDWKNYGGLDEIDSESIEQKDIGEQRFQLLYKWYKGQTNSTFQDLIEAAPAENLEQLAEEVKELATETSCSDGVEPASVPPEMRNRSLSRERKHGEVTMVTVLQIQRTLAAVLFVILLQIMILLYGDWKPSPVETYQVSSTNHTPTNYISIYLESFHHLNAFYGNSFTLMEKDIPHTCPLPYGGTCTLHHSRSNAKVSDVVVRMVRFVYPGVIVRYHKDQLLAVMNSEAERGEYGLQQLREADIKIDYHPSSEIMLADVCGLPVQKWETSPPPDPTQRKGIAMFTSNCKATWRSEYFEKLHKFIRIDSYGRCFHNKDEPSTHNKGASLVKISSNYRMVVTFENLIQDDYISEKIVFAFASGAIPVYWGPPQIYSWVPGNHSFIDASKYGPEDLAKYLKRVNVEDDLFRYHTTNFDIDKTKEMLERLCPKDVHYVCRICQIAQKKLLRK